MADGNSSDEPANHCSHLRQGHLLTGEALGQPEVENEFVIVSQTCDVVLTKRPTISVAEVRRLTGDELGIAGKRDNPRFVPLPTLGGDAFADLAYIQSFPKERIGAPNPVDAIGLGNDIATREFALAVGRWFSRYAFPDDVVPWFRPLVDLARDKHDRPTSPLGRVLNQIVEFRIEAGDWSVRPLELVLVVIARAGVVPQVEEPPSNATLAQRLRTPDGSPKAPSVIAEILSGLTASEDRLLGWGVFVESLAAACVPRSRDQTEEVLACVASIEGELTSDDDYSLARVRRSEQLDLDYLSGPVPYGPP